MYNYRAMAAVVTICAAILILLTGAVAAEVVGPDYTIGPGDMLDIQVYGEADLSREYPVGPAGTLFIPLIGQVAVADLTLEQAQEVLTEKLKEIMRAPHVVVGLNETASVRKAYVLGYVANQGPVLLPFGAGVVDALAAAGTTDLSDLRYVRVSHPAQAPKTLDLSGLRTGEAVAVSEKVRYGDVIYVPRLEDRIAVLGQVQTPGSTILPLGQKVTVLDALARIGGGLSAEASLANALLVHTSGQVTTVDLEALLKRGDTAQNCVLAPGDVLVVQQTDNISIVGEVNQPLTFRSAEPVSVLEALAQAGGFTPRADLEKAQIVAAGNEVKSVNLRALWEEGDLSQNFQLAAGDVLLLPERPPTNLLIVGEVAKAGVMDLAGVEQRDLLRIVTAAGRTPQADLSQVHVYRGDQQYTVDLEAVMDGELDKNMQLEPDDVVMVPEKETVYLLGAVARQGKMPWDPELTILDALTSAGGMAPRANENGTLVLRVLPDGSTEAIKVAMGDIAKGEAPNNVALQAGDIVYVPHLGERGKVWGMLRDMLWAVGALVAIGR